MMDSVQPNRWRAKIWILGGILGLCACSGPEPEGGYIPKVPEGFVYSANADEGRPVFPEREELSQTAWMTLREEEHSSIFMTEYAGSAARHEVQRARDAQANRYGGTGHMYYSDLEPIQIDRRPAWGWLETQVSGGEVVGLEFKAVVPYEDVTYAVEFFTSDPRFMDENLLREKVASFRLGKRRSQPET